MSAGQAEPGTMAGAAAPADEGAVVRVEKLVKCFGSNRVLDGIDLAIAKGEVVSLMGQSGGGKTTLLRCINLLEEPTSGLVEVGGEVVSEGGESLHRARRVALRQRVGMVFQSFNLFQHLTAAENVALPLLRVGKVERAEAVARAVDLLGRVGLAGKALELPARLSGGQQQRVAIARALALRPVAMLFDEPTSALDPESSAEVLGVMRELSTEGITMLVSTHEVSFALDASDRIVFIDRGKVVQAGPPREVVFGSASERARDFFAGFVRYGSSASSPAESSAE
jgi:polar amino acid transport system ATP-binding protein